LLARPLLNPRVAVAAGGVYLAWQVPGGAGWRIARIAPATGRAEVTAALPAALDQLVAAAGALWAAVSGPSGQQVLRLDPRTLAVTGRRLTWPQGYPLFGGAHALAVAGGGLWVAAAGALLRLALPSGRLSLTVRIPGAASADVSAGPAGAVLVVGEADREGRGAVQARDPVTGALLASRPMLGVVAPEVSGPAGGAVWVSEPTGMMGYVQRLGLPGLTAGPGSCPDGGVTARCVGGTNAITARIAGGRLWVTDPAGGARRNYCADPATGRPLAPLRLPDPALDEILAIGPAAVYYATPGPGDTQYVRELAIPAACAGRRGAR